MERVAVDGRGQPLTPRWDGPPPCAPPLLGGPEQPFSVRHNLTFMRTDALLDYISLVFNTLGVIRFWPYLFPAAATWLALHFVLPLANIAWRRRCMAACPSDGGSWGRYREALCAVVRATACMGVTWELALATFEAERGMDGSVWFDRSASAAALNLVNISAAIVIVMLSFKPMRVSIALPLQLALTYVCYARYASYICSHPTMLVPHLQPVLRATAGALDIAAWVLHPVLPRHGTILRSDGAECVSLLVFLQLSACLLTALYKAHEEQRLFEVHQWQRGQHGLPPEGGWDARVYGIAAELLQPWGRASLLWGVLLAVLLWQMAVVLHSFGLV